MSFIFLQGAFGANNVIATLMSFIILQGAPGAGNAIATMLSTFTAQVQPLAVPLAVFGGVLWGLAILATPLLPEWSGTMRGYFQKALLAVGFIAFIPGVMQFAGGLGGGAP
jgi:hypothetical protein